MYQRGSYNELWSRIQSSGPPAIKGYSSCLFNLSMARFTHLKVEIIENASKEAGGFNEIICFEWE